MVLLLLIGHDRLFRTYFYLTTYILIFNNYINTYIIILFIWSEIIHISCNCFRY
jgi:hypothetical protein